MYIKKRTILIFTSIIVLIFSAAGVYAATTESINTTTIYACLTKEDDHSFRLVDANTPCKKRETRISWNVVGPKGDKGDPGVAGPAGPQGPQGPTGKDGATGPQGPAGKDGTVGSQGPEGPQGPAGPLGPSGKDGAAGPAGVPGAAGPQGPKGDSGSKVISGSVARDGTIDAGSGFTVTRSDTGHYMITFLPGVFTKQTIMTVTSNTSSLSVAHVFSFGSYNGTKFTGVVTKDGANDVDADFSFIATEVQ